MKSYREFIQYSCFETNESILYPENIVNGKLPIIEEDTIDGDFIISYFGVSSLENCPNRIMGSLYAENNNLKNLDFFPEKVGVGIYLKSNALTSLEGLPRKCSGVLNISNNPLTSLKHVCERIDTLFIFDYLNLTSLEYYPSMVGQHANRFKMNDNLQEQYMFVRSNMYNKVMHGEEYFETLLKYLKQFNESVDKITKIDWPDYFIDLHPDLLKSAKGIRKFGL